MGCRIEAIEYVFPKKKLTNNELQNIFLDYDFSKFEKKVGIQSRYVVAENETGLDIAIQAVEKLFASGVDRNEIDYLLYCTQSPEYILPTTACILQDKLGLRKNIGAFDFNLGCSGFSYGVSFAKALINSNQAKKIVLVTAETYSKFIHPEDRTNRSIFGDAATATLIVESDENRIGEFLFGTDGQGYDKLIIKNGGSKFKFDSTCGIKEYGTGNKYSDNHLYMDGPEIFNFTSNIIPKFAEELLKQNNLERESIQQFIFHQANAFMLNFMRKRLKIPQENFYIDLMESGNTVSNTIPIALKNYSQSITKKEKIILVGFGVGLSWSGGMIEISKPL
ncbi:3-oxoacyl-ACP synthase [Polaribacter pacificus]|uniref:3-oxoacyl-ACP synthase n=1 Tax=Polaribacter pacificus TaxID=1775173 RepID=A0A917I0L1_9FLAO|nr:ketoacyl-ACP synthase III [Polaribacter pacificus]GGH01696.1 3-oxoacyl-ACP synthase [Polaribacter pacificus]